MSSIFCMHTQSTYCMMYLHANAANISQTYHIMLKSCTCHNIYSHTAHGVQQEKLSDHIWRKYVTTCKFTQTHKVTTCTAVELRMVGGETIGYPGGWRSTRRTDILKSPGL